MKKKKDRPEIVLSALGWVGGTNQWIWGLNAERQPPQPAAVRCWATPWHQHSYCSSHLSCLNVRQWLSLPNTVKEAHRKKRSCLRCDTALNWLTSAALMVSLFAEFLTNLAIKRHYTKPSLRTRWAKQGCPMLGRAEDSMVLERNFTVCWAQYLSFPWIS